MEEFWGQSIYAGAVIGNIYFYRKNQQQVIRRNVTDADAELSRFEQAKTIAKQELIQLYQKAVAEVGMESAAIFEVHGLMLDDVDYNNAVQTLICGEEVNVEYAVAATGDYFSTVFSKMEDEYMKARATDMKDITARMLAVLQEADLSQQGMEEPVILVAEELTPSETVQMDKCKLLSIVTRNGSANSHTAILARTMNLPSLVGVEVEERWNGHPAIVDGKTGKIIIDPDEKTLKKYKAVIQLEEEKKNLLNQLKGKPDITRSGKEIKLYANIGSVADVEDVLANDAAGIGLFRSEFLYLEKNDYPTEEEQFQAYKSVVEKMAGKKVIIRTLDIGADKKVGYFGLEQEENPAMGYRAIRICLDRVDIFKTQLRALYRASAFGSLSILFPMIISVEEIADIKSICQEVCEELKAEGIAYGKVELGAMIETPAAVMISDLLAKEVDFFSIGTNDLTQYTLALDRQNPKLDKQYQPHHEAVLRMIQMVIDHGHREGRLVGICGELAADITLTERLISMGIDELSVSPGFVLPVRKAIREI